MSDQINREDAIKAIYHHFPQMTMRECAEVLHEVPSAHRWIPVSERLPKNDDWVIVTILDEWGDTPWTYTDFGWYLEAANCWVIDARQRTDVIAWMSLPEPWKGE